MRLHWPPAAREAPPQDCSSWILRRPLVAQQPARNARIARWLLWLFGVWCGVLTVLLTAAEVNTTDNATRVMLRMILGLIILWVLGFGLVSLAVRRPLRAWAERHPHGWPLRFVLLATALALLEEAVTVTMTNLGPGWGATFAQAHITASANYLDVVLLHSVIVFVPMFVVWAWLLTRYAFSPAAVLLLFGVTGFLAEAAHLRRQPDLTRPLGLRLRPNGLSARQPRARRARRPPATHRPRPTRHRTAHRRRDPRRAHRPGDPLRLLPQPAVVRPRPQTAHCRQTILIEQCGTCGQAAWIIEAQQEDGGAANGRQRLNARTIPSKMIVPAVGARVEEVSSFAGLRIDGGEVWTLEPIALMAGVGKVLKGRRAAMLNRDNMVRFVWEERHSVGHPTVFAPPARTIMHVSAQGLAHPLTHASAVEC